MIIRTEKTKNFTTIANFALNDPNLSLKAKGLWTFIMTKPNKWNFTGRSLEADLKEGRGSINTTLKELEVCGYLHRGIITNRGKFSQGENILYEKPWMGKPSTENPSTNKILNKVNTKSPTDSTEKPPEPNDTISFGELPSPPSSAAPPTAKALYYRVIKKYKLVVANHGHIGKWANDLENTHGSERAIRYLERLLDRDIVEEQKSMEFVPTLNTPFDIANKSTKIIQYFVRTKDQVVAKKDSNDYYDRVEKDAKKIRKS